MILFIDAYYFLLFVLFLPSVYSADIAPVLHPFETDTLYVIVGLGSCFLVGLAKGGNAQHPSSGGDRRHVRLSRAARLARSGASQLCGILFGCSGMEHDNIIIHLVQATYDFVLLVAPRVSARCRHNAYSLVVLPADVHIRKPVFRDCQKDVQYQFL